MKHVIPFALLAALAVSCDKEVDTGTLMTNPLDPDYIGIPLVEFAGDSSYKVFDNAVAVDTVYRLKYHIRTDLFPHATAYSVEARQVGGDGTVEQHGPLPFTADNVFTTEMHHVTYGNSYCVDAQVLVSGSGSKVFRVCGTAHE